MNRLQRAIELNASGGPILGAAAYLYSPDFIEIASLLGFTAAWVEMEHTFVNFAQAADLCRTASGARDADDYRIPDSRRETVVKAAECGPDILDLPMANTPELLEELVRYARFPPLGERGFFGISRAVKYGIPDTVASIQQKLNAELCLMVQIETKRPWSGSTSCVRCRESTRYSLVLPIFRRVWVCRVTGHPKLFAAAERTIRAARAHGKHVATAAAPQDFPFWVDQAIDLLFAANDLTAMKVGAQFALETARKSISSRT